MKQRVRLTISRVTLWRLAVFILLCEGSAGQPPPRYDTQVAMDEDPKFTELDLPASERNSQLVYIPPARAPWAKHITRWLSDRRLMAQKLYPNMQQNYTLVVPLDGNMAITVHPRRGFITWNITYLDIKVMVHPYFTHFIHPRLPLEKGQKPVQAMPWEAHKRQKRCCIAGAVTFNYDFDVVELNAGLGKSLGPGSITYFKEDVSGGIYTLWVHNLGRGSAEFVVYATRRPEFSPYPRIHHNDPQLKVRTIEAKSITVEWMKAPDSPNVNYCVVYHEAAHHHHDDVHSSSFAVWMERETAVHLPCTKESHKEITKLKPNTEYHIDLLAHNQITLRETTFMGVIARTKMLPGASRGRNYGRGRMSSMHPEHPPPDFRRPPLDPIHRWVPVMRNISAIYYPPQWRLRYHNNLTTSSGNSIFQHERGKAAYYIALLCTMIAINH